MAIALFALPSLFAPLAWAWRPRTAPARRATPKPVPRPAPAAAPIAAVVRPLRVVHVLEASPRPSGAGRMVISGRLADVCAELDRLAALEAAGR